MGVKRNHLATKRATVASFGTVAWRTYVRTQIFCSIAKRPAKSLAIRCLKGADAVLASRRPQDGHKMAPRESEVAYGNVSWHLGLTLRT